MTYNPERLLKYKDLKTCPWQQPALDLLSRFFPRWESSTTEEFTKFCEENPKTMARFTSLWNGIPIYFSQRDNFAQPHRTCNSSSNAMYLLSYFPWSLWNEGDDEYLKAVIQIGDTTSHTVQTTVLLKYGLASNWDTSANKDKFLQKLDARTPVPVNILHRGVKPNYKGGHVIVPYALTDDKKSFIYHDPYGNIQQNYKLGSNGKSNVMSLNEFYSRWQGGARYRK